MQALGVLMAFFLFHALPSHAIIIDSFQNGNEMRVQDVVLENCTTPTNCAASTGTITLTADIYPAVSTTGSIGYVTRSMIGAHARILRNNNADRNSTITRTEFPTTCTVAGGGRTFTLSGITSTYTGAYTVGGTTTPSNASGDLLGEFYIGATLTIPPNTPLGRYYATSSGGNCRITMRRDPNGGGSGQGQANLVVLINIVNGQVAGSFTVNQETPLSFGTVSLSNLATNIIMDPSNGTIASLGAATLAGDHQLGEFSVINTSNSSFNVRITPSGTNLTGPGTSIPFTPTAQSSIFVPAQNGAIPGVATFKVGGLLAINANQAVGNYNGVYNVTVDF